MRNEIKTKAVNLPSDISSFILIQWIIITNSPFMKLFSEQQKSAFSKKGVGKYHAMILLVIGNKVRFYL